LRHFHALSLRANLTAPPAPLGAYIFRIGRTNMTFKTALSRIRTRRRGLFLEPLEKRLALASVFGVGNQEIVEGDSGTQEMVFTVQRENVENDYSQTESIRYIVNHRGRTPNSAEWRYEDETLNDFVGQSGVLSFEPEQRSQEIRVAIRGDYEIEATETFAVRLSPDIEFFPPVAVDYAHNPSEQVTGVAFAPAIQVGVSTLLVSAYDENPLDPHGLVRVVTNLGNPSLASLGAVRSPGDSLVSQAFAADMDGDGVGDVLVASNQGLVVYRGLTGQASSFDAGTLLAPLGAYSVNDFAVADANKDGLPDLALADADAKLAYFQNTSSAGNISFATPQIVPLATQPSKIKLGDLNADGIPEIVSLNAPVSFASPSLLTVLTGYDSGNGTTFYSDAFAVYFRGAENTASNIAITFGTQPVQPIAVDLELTDWDDDGLLDLGFAIQDDYGSGLVHQVFRNEYLDGQSFLSFWATLAQHYRGGAAIGYDFAVADFNYDQLPDAVQMLNLQYPEISLLQNQRSQYVYMPPGFYTAQPTDTLAIGDLDGDGADDVLVIQPGRGISVALNHPNRTGISTQSVAIGAILDDDTPVIRLSQSRDSVVVGNPELESITITAEIVGGRSQSSDLTIPLVIDPGSTAELFGVDWPDFSLSAHSILIAAGFSSGAITFTAQPDDPANVDPDEIAILRAQPGAGYVLQSNSPLTTTIVSPATVTLAIDRNLVREPSGQFRLNLFSSKPVQQETTVRIAYLPGESTASPGDLQLDSDIITIPAGKTHGSVLVSILNDDVYEGTEYVTFAPVEVLSGAVVLSPDNAATATILDDDSRPSAELARLLSDGSIAVGNARLAEAGGSSEFVALIPSPQANDLRVKVTSSGGVSALEYTAAVGGSTAAGPLYEVLIPAGETRSVPLRITSVDDTVVEGDETLVLQLVDSSAYSLGNVTSASILVADDDQSLGRLSITASADSIAEAGGVAGFVIQLDQVATSPITVTLAYSGTALSSEFSAPRSVVIPTGKNFALATVVGIDDVVREPEETIVVAIESVSTSVQVANSSAAISIVDDDDPPVVRILTGESRIVERQTNPAVGWIELNTVSAYDTVVHLALTGTATAGVDYAISSDTVTIPAGSVLGSFTISPVVDALLEGAETIVASLASVELGPGGRELGEIHPTQNSVTFSIIDDIVLTKFSSSPVQIDEDVSTARTTFRVQNPFESTSPVILRVVSSDPAIIDPADVQIAFRSTTPRDANRDNRTLTFKPRPHRNGAVVLTVIAQAGASEPVQLEIPVQIRAVNDPPAFTGAINSGAFSLAPINEDVPSDLNTGTSVKAILDGSANPARPSGIGWSDQDGAGALRGIAIVSAQRTNGDWQYSLDGGSTWNSLQYRDSRIGSNIDVSYTRALLLPADDAQQARLRFLPKADYAGYFRGNALTFLAWDQTTGSPGTFVDISRVGGEAGSAFGNFAMVVADVMQVNDRPELRIDREVITLPAINERQSTSENLKEYSVPQLLATLQLAGGTAWDSETRFPGIVFTPIFNGYTYTDNWEFNDGSGWKKVRFFEDVLLTYSYGSVRYVSQVDANLAFAPFNRRPNYSIPGLFGLPGTNPPEFEVRIWDGSFGVGGKYTISPAEKQSGVSQAVVKFQLPIVNINDRPSPELGGEFKLGDALRSDVGIPVGQLFERYSLLYDDNYRPFWKDRVDEDSINDRIGLALLDISRDVYLEVSYNFEPFQNVGLYSTAATGTYVPIPLNSRIRMVSRSGRELQPEQYWAKFGFHDGDRDYRTPFYNRVTETPNALRSLWAPITINALSPLEGSVTGNATATIDSATIASQAVNSAAWWQAAGLGPTQLGSLAQAELRLADLAGNMLGLASRGTITIDSTAAGVSWFIDPTPDENEEFELSPTGELIAKSTGPAAGKYDLLSVLAHEQGHLLGLADILDPQKLMGYQLSPGLRRKPTAAEVDLLFGATCGIRGNG
jgi:hypothetical protein